MVINIEKIAHYLLISHTTDKNNKLVKEHDGCNMF